MNHQEHNGWYNYETWVVNLWMDNERGSHDYWRERAREALDGARPQKARTYASQTQPERAKCVLADDLKEQHEEALPELEGFAADLLNAAMSEVNWYEIAGHLVDELVEEVSVTKVVKGEKK
jgi:hypothetical protein